MKLLAYLQDLLEPMRRPEPTRPCPTLADTPALPAPVATSDVVRVDLAALRKVRLEVRADG